jgi:hypothetical protein
MAASLARNATLCAAVLFAIGTGGCKKNVSAEPDGGAAIADAKVEPAVDFVGECTNETSGVPWTSVFFFPKKNEMFMHVTKGAVRVPVNVTEQGPRKLDFTIRWSENDEPATTRTGSVTAVGGKWQFEFESLKSALCRPKPAPDFYKQLTEFGFQAGKWENKKARVAIVIAADAQEWILTLQGKTTTIHYRVLEHTDNRVLLATFGKTPGAADYEGWSTSRLIRTGDTIVHEFDDSKLEYKLVSAAPTLK